MDSWESLHPEWHRRARSTAHEDRCWQVWGVDGALQTLARALRLDGNELVSYSADRVVNRGRLEILARKLDTARLAPSPAVVKRRPKTMKLKCLRSSVDVARSFRWDEELLQRHDGDVPFQFDILVRDDHCGVAGVIPRSGLDETSKAVAFQVSKSSPSTESSRLAGGPTTPPSTDSDPNPSAPPSDNDNAKLCIVAVATEWYSGNGGLSTFNRQLCTALAEAGHDVFCIVLDATDQEVRDAKEEANVILVPTPPEPGASDGERLLRRPRLPLNRVPDIIIGHGRVTGRAARAVQEDYFPTAKRVHFIHMAPDEIEWLKLDRKDDAGERAETRTQIEKELASKASCVAAVGPVLYGRFVGELPSGSPTPVRFDPGFDTSSLGYRMPPSGDPWRILVLGRIEDDFLKGLDIAAASVGRVAKRRKYNASKLELIVRGAPRGTSDAVYKYVRQKANNSELSIVIRPYSSDAERLDEDLNRASLVLMPSRAEGFGLVGLEAIVAGTPVLLSDKSGIGVLLQQMLNVETAGRFVVGVTKSDSDDDHDTWGREIKGVLRDRDAAFKRAGELRELLAKKKTWSGSVAELLRAVRAAER